MGLKLPGDEEVMQLENPGVSGSKKIGNEFPTAFAPGVSEESSTVNPAEFDALWNSSTNPDLNPGVVSDVNLQTSSIKYPQYSEGITKQRTTSTSRSRSKNVSQAAVGREIKREQIDEDMKDEDVVIVSTEKGNPDLHEMQEACDPMTVGDLHGQQDILESSSHHPVESQPYVLPGLGWGTDDAGPSVEKTVMNPPQWSVPSSHPTTSTEGHKSTYDPTSSIHDEVKTESDDVILVDPTGSAEGSLDHRPVVSRTKPSIMIPQLYGAESLTALYNFQSINSACGMVGGRPSGNQNGPRKKEYPCRYCGKLLSDPSNRRKHERIHTADRRYSCTFCGRSFIQNYTRRKHEQTIHLSRKDKTVYSQSTT